MHTINDRLLVGVVTTFALVLGGCAGDGGDADDTAAGAPTDQGDAATGDTANTGGEETDDAATDDAATTDEADGGGEAVAEATLAVASSDLGDIVVDGEGRTLYMFVPDEGGEPTCTDACAETWPVFEGPASAGQGADASLLSTASHPSGATQVTYGDWPMYYFASDQAAGDTNGQGVNDVWFVVGPDGEPIRDAAAASEQDTGY